MDGSARDETEQQGWNVGYSAAGQIVELGNGISDLAAGDWVACAGAGKANHADYVSVPRNLVCRIPPGCSVRDAATAAVGAIALQGVRRAAPQLGERTAVLGLGLIGQLTLQMLRANGCIVLGTDLDPKRVARARELGMEAGAENPEAFKQLVRDWTEGRGADRTLVTAASTSDAVVNLAMELTRAKGTVVIVGDVGLGVRRDVFYRKELDLLMSTSYGPGRYDSAYEDEGKDYPFAYVRWTLNRNMRAYLELIASKRLHVDSVIDRVVPVDEAPGAYAALASASSGAPIGVLLRYGDEPPPPDTTGIALNGHRKAPKASISYALVGAGAFGTSMLVPQMEKLADRFFLRAVVSRNTTVGGNFARAHRVEILSTDLENVLANESVDLVVIATRHHEHATQATRALKAGKHVFVEKPLALTWEELEQVATTYEALNPRPLLLVGFNRRFSPALQTLRECLSGRRSPLVMSYRVHAGFVPAEHWVQGSQGGGRNLGEACHMHDVFRFLAGCPAVSITAMSIDPGSLPYMRNDNFSATVRYEEGSVGTLVYTALGPKEGLSKERLEVFCDGDAYVLDDYRSLVRASDGCALWKSESADKGHSEELKRLGDAIAGGLESPIAFDELVETTAVALHVEDLIFGRRGMGSGSSVDV